MRGGPAKPSGQAQPPPTQGFTSNLNVQTTQLFKGLTLAFYYCPVLSPEGSFQQKLEQAAQSESVTLGYWGRPETSTICHKEGVLS